MQTFTSTLTNNKQQQQQLQLQPLPQSLSQSSASEVSTRSSPASPNSTISLAPQILRIPSRPFQQQTRQNLLRQSDLPLHYPISGKTSGPNASNITGSIASTISGSRKVVYQLIYHLHHCYQFSQLQDLHYLLYYLNHYQEMILILLLNFPCTWWEIKYGIWSHNCL